MTILAPPILLKLRLLYTHWLYGAAKTWAFILTRFVGWETWPNFSPWGICEKHIWCILRYVLFTINGQKNGDYHKYRCTGFFLRKRKSIFLFIFLFPSFQFCSSGRTNNCKFQSAIVRLSHIQKEKPPIQTKDFVLHLDSKSRSPSISHKCRLTTPCKHIVIVSWSWCMSFLVFNGHCQKKSIVRCYDFSVLNNNST